MFAMWTSWHNNITTWTWNQEKNRDICRRYLYVDVHITDISDLMCRCDIMSLVSTRPNGIENNHTQSVINTFYYTLNSLTILNWPSVWWIFEISTRDVIMPRTLKVTGNHVNFPRFLLLPVSKKSKNMTSIFFVQCIIKQLLDSVFVISRIIKVSVRVISLSLRLRLITLTSTFIILGITKTSSNNSLKATDNQF